MLAAGDHANIMPRKRQFDREIAPDSAGTENTDLHRIAHVLTGRKFFRPASRTSIIAG